MKPNPPDLAWYFLESGISQVKKKKKKNHTGLIPSLPAMQNRNLGVQETLAKPQVLGDMSFNPRRPKYPDGMLPESIARSNDSGIKL